MKQRLREMVAELLILLPGISFTDILNMYWEEVKTWHDVAVQTTKKLRGQHG